MAFPISYRILIERKAQRESEKVPRSHREAIDKAILSLASNPRPRNAIKLTDKEGYRIRIGSYRVLYTIDDEAKLVVVYRVKIRDESTYRD
jgi:mRNA interferase RelE/StbE